MNKRKILGFFLSLALVVCTFSACGDAKAPGEKNDAALKDAPESIELVSDDDKTSDKDVTAITAATDINGKVTDSVGITDKTGHKIYSTGQTDTAGQTIYTTGKKDSKGNILYTKNNLDSFGNLIYYTGKYDDNGKLTLTPSQESPDYSTNDTPNTPVTPATTTTTTTVGADIKSDITITDANIKYTKYFGGSGMDAFNSIGSCKDGGYIAAGIFTSTDGDLQGVSKNWSDTHSAVVKYSVDGAVEWKYVIGGDKSVSFSSAAELKDGSIIAAGYTMATNIEAKLNAKSISAIIFRLTKSGELMWMYSFPNDGNSNGDYISSIAATPDGGFVVGGKAISTSGFFTGTQEKGSKGFLFKFDKNCNVKWRRILTGSKSNNFSAIDVNSSGDIFATCVTTSTDGDFSAIQYSSSYTTNTVLMKFDKNGNLKWSDYLQGSGASEYNAVSTTSDGGCIVGGTYTVSKKADGIYSISYGKSDGYVIRYNSDGKVCWARAIGGAGSDKIKGITEVDGGYAVVGQTTSANGDFQGQKAGGEEDGFVIYLNEKGERSVTILLDGSASDSVNAVCTLNDGSIAIAGWTTSKDNAFSGSGASKQYMAFVSRYEVESEKTK